MRPQEKECFDLTLESDEGKYISARNGDHLIIPFQSEICHY